MTNRLFFVIPCFLLMLLASQPTSGDEIDVFLLAGQSNGGNFGELNSWDPQGYNGLNRDDAVRSEQGFQTDFARIYDRTSTGANRGLDDVFHSFSSTQLDPGQFASDRLAVELNAIHGNRIGLFSYNRNGRPLYNDTDDSEDDGQSWYAGDDPAGGQVYDAELYGHFKGWTDARIAELEAQGHSVNVRGVFWFQGEKDVQIGDIAVDAYEANFENLVERFRLDYGQDLAVVAAEIHEIATSNGDYDDRQMALNAALRNVAEGDDLVEVVSVEDLQALSNTNVHLHQNGYYDLASLWSEAYEGIAVPEPGSGSFLLAGFLGSLLYRRRQIAC
jgi:hypothetical protein